MPGFDGTGPRGQGPLSGRGEGYCAMALPEGQAPFGYAGRPCRPILPGGAPAPLGVGRRFPFWPPHLFRRGSRAYGHGRARGRGWWGRSTRW